MHWVEAAIALGLLNTLEHDPELASLLQSTLDSLGVPPSQLVAILAYTCGTVSNTPRMSE